MKKIILIIILSLFSIPLANAQWIIQPTGNVHPIRDVEFINRYTGWACGDNHIYKTTNGGSNWVEQSHPDAYLIQQICPVNDSVVYACDWWNFMKTINGGSNWFSLFDSVPSTQLPVLEALYFLNENTGWLAGNVVVMKTTNGGNSFVDSMRIEGDVRDIYFKDSLNGITCGMVGDFQKTTNGGVNWFELEIIKNGSLYNFIRIGKIENNLWIGGKSIYKSTDYGLTWDSIALVGEMNNVERMYAINFSSLNIGYIGGNRGGMFKTTDGGYNWKMENSGTSTSIIYSIDSFNDSIVWASRGNGTIINTSTGGQTGIENLNQQQPTNYKLYQNFPNPFNPETNIEFEIFKPGFTQIKIYNLLGEEKNSLVNEYLKSGKYKLNFNASGLTSGVYFYRLFVNEFIETKKMILIK
jgi:photosystem II stability/assembly factor-like uncharacterized protein